MGPDMFATEQQAVPVGLTDQLAKQGLEGAVEVGRGGFGVVFRCQQVELDRSVAVKVLTVDLQDNRARFLREQRAMARLTGHPNIIAVLTVGETDDGFPYLVMPYCEQGSLQDRIARAGRLPLDQVFAVGVKIAGALESAHQLDVVHRDVKPGNIMLTDFGEPALTDFGIAHIAGGFRTATGVFTGSPAFTAPEILAGDPPTASSDVYGLGATLFCALTGHAAYERRQGEQVIAQFLRITAEPLPDLRNQDIPGEIAGVVEAAMAHAPDDRPTAAQLGKRLQQLQSSRGWIVDALPLRVRDDRARGQAKPSSSTWRVRLRGNLPTTRQGVVGRHDEIVQITALLSGWRLVTLTGVGGVGKTTLALEAASRLRTEFADGVWLVELAELQDGALLTETVAAALGVRDQAGRRLLDVLVDVIASHKVLLLLDNCEHLIDDVATLAQTLLRECPQLQILATSRELLDIDGEAVFAVTPLACPAVDGHHTMGRLATYDAVALFLSRAAAAVNGYELTPSNADSIASICARVEGLPLAIELAAARLRAMSAEQIAAELSTRYELLSRRGRRGTPERQQTLTECMEWSYRLCSPPEQQLWSQLSAFPASFDLHAAHYVCADSNSIEQFLDALSGLVDKSILIRVEHHRDVRFRFLEALRHFGAEQLPRGDEERGTLLDRHATYYQSVVSRARELWFTAEQPEWIRRLVSEMPNIRQALQHTLLHQPERSLRMAALLRPMWIFGGMLGEGRQWLDLALAANPKHPNESRLEALAAAAHIAMFSADLEGAGAYVAEARDYLEQIQDPSLAGYFDFLEGYCAIVSGDITGAREHSLQALANCDDIEARVESMLMVGWYAIITGDETEATEWVTKGRALAEAHGDVVLRTHALATAALSHWQQGDRDAAIEAVQQAMRLAISINDSWSGAQFLEMSAWVVVDADPRRAAMLMGAAYGTSRASGASSIPTTTMGPFHDQTEQLARAELGATQYDAAFTSGTKLSFEEASGLALDEERRKAT